MPLEHVLWSNLIAIGAALFLLWCASLRLKNVNLVDLFWGVGFALIGWVSLWATGRTTPRTVLLVIMVTVWGLRLASYLAWRNHGKPEDHRYAAMRQKHGKRFPIVSLFTVFGLQGLLMWIIALPIQVGLSKNLSCHVGVAIGVMLWLIGLFFETLGDFQLARFKANPENRGQVMKQGLWRYTRHPNYFGDFLVWWGLYLASAESGSWWWTVLGPLLMTFLLLRVSGVSLLESSLRKRVFGYEQYVRETSALFPVAA